MHEVSYQARDTFEKYANPVMPVAKRRPAARKRKMRVLLVTPEISESSFLATNGKQAPSVKAGGLADVSALLFDSLTDAGADVHVALPHFRSLFEPGPNGHSPPASTFARTGNSTTGNQFTTVVRTRTSAPHSPSSAMSSTTSCHASGLTSCTATTG